MSRRRRWAALAVLCALPLVAGAEEEKKPKEGRYSWGALRFTPLLRVTSGVDTNVFQTLADPTRDAVVIVSPRVDGILPVGHRLRLTGLAYTDVFYYRRQDDERSVDFAGQGRGDLRLGPVTVFAGGGGGQFTQRFSIDVDDRLKRQEKRGYAGLTWQATRRLSLTGQGANEIMTFAPGQFRLGGDVKEALDRNSLIATGQIRFALSGRTTLLASGETQNDRFFSQPDDFPSERHSYRAVSGFEFSGRGLLSGRFLAGLRVFPGTLEDTGSPPYRGPVVSADLTFGIGQVARIHLLGDRDVLYSSSIVEVGTLKYRNAYVYDHYMAEATLEMPWRCVAVLQTGFERADYLLPYPYPTFFTLNDRVDNRYSAGATLFRRFGETLRLGGHILWARRVSSLPYFSYEGLRYGISAEVRP